MGINMANELQIFVTDPKVTQQIFTNVNKYHSKAESFRDMMHAWTPQSIIFQATCEPDYTPKRKALSSAFFKSKLKSFEEIIKNVTYKQLAESQEMINLPMFFLDLVSRILMNIAVGPTHEKTLVEYEQEDGKIVKMPLGRHISTMIEDLIWKIVQVQNMVEPSLVKRNITARDFRFKRNVENEKNVIRKMIRERKEGKSGTYFKDQSDLLSVLVDNEFYRDQEEKIVDEVIMIFLAGSKTTQNTAANMFCYFEKNPEIKKIVQKEIDDKLTPLSNDIMGKFD